MKTIFDRYDLAYNLCNSGCKYIHGECPIELSTYCIRYLGKNLDILDVSHGDTLEQILISLDTTISNIIKVIPISGKNIGNGVPIFKEVEEEKTLVFRTIKNSDSINVKLSEEDKGSTLKFNVEEKWLLNNINQELKPFKESLKGLEIVIEDVRNRVDNINKEMDKLNEKLNTKVDKPAEDGLFYLSKKGGDITWKSAESNYNDYYATLYFPNIYHPLVHEVSSTIGKVRWERIKSGTYIGQTSTFLHPARVIVMAQINQDTTNDGVPKFVRIDRHNDYRIIMFVTCIKNGVIAPYDPPSGITIGVSLINFFPPN